MARDSFEDDQVTELLDRISKGEPLIAICRDPRMPGRRTVYDWIEADPEFAAQFHAARARGVHALAEECLAIADDQKEDPASRRVRIDTRLRLAGKWLPREYGEKVQHEGKVDHTVALDAASLPPALAFLAQHGAEEEGGPDDVTG